MGEWSGERRRKTVPRARILRASMKAEAQAQNERQNLLHAQKLESLGLLAGGIAHDFNNLLMGILGNASMAQDALAQSPETARACLADIEEASQQAAALCRQLLSYVGKGARETTRVDLGALVREMTKLLSVGFPKHVALYTELPDQPSTVRVDATQIRQVLMNLVINAGDAIDHEGSVFVRVGERRFGASELNAHGIDPGRYVFVEVQDTGPGIPDRHRQRIFEPFFTTKASGRGLGLSAVRGIVEAHEGALQLESIEGVGTTFRILLPPAASAPEATPSQTPPRPHERSGRILVVDDERLVRRMATRCLRRAGYEVCEAVDGRDALARFAKEPDSFHAVLLDMMMPRLSGPETLVRLRRIRPELCVVMSSGYSRREAGAILEGAYASFLQKPYRPAELVDALDTLLARREADAPSARSAQR